MKKSTIKYHAQGELYTYSVIPLSSSSAMAMTAAGPMRRRRAAGESALAEAISAGTPRIEFDPKAFIAAVRRSKTMQKRLPTADPENVAMLKTPGSGRRATLRPAYAGAMTFMTPSVIVDGAHASDIAAAVKAGARVEDEGQDGKTLLGVDSINDVARICDLLMKRNVGSVTPNFLRRYARTPLSTQPQPWAHDKVRLSAAWTITRGSKAISVAILDEGVDTSHPALKRAVIAQRDFIGDNGNSAMPDGNDAHGTACAGIVLGRGSKGGGLAPRCSLIAARIAMDDGYGNWIFDDYATADAIDWCWRSGAAVLSNSWGGGAPSDAISRAFGRARTQGRSGKGSIVCIAAGNDQSPIDFPGNLSGYVTVGASTPRDERKTKTSSDGETWWGSNYGSNLWLLAPGVFIHTSDISGPSGYDPGNFTSTFNGTSSATPHVAGAAALMLSANAKLTASAVRTLLASTAKRIQKQTGWTAELGHGRLDVGAAVAAAKKSPAAAVAVMRQRP